MFFLLILSIVKKFTKHEAVYVVFMEVTIDLVNVLMKEWKTKVNVCVGNVFFFMIIFR